MTQSAPGALTIPPELREKLSRLTAELMTKSYELAFEYTTLECKNLMKCSLACKARDLFKTVKELYNVLRQTTLAKSPSYVS